VTVLRIHHGIFEELTSKGIGKLGGDDIDNALATVIGKRFEEKTGYDLFGSPYRTQFLIAVEKAKIELSNGPTAVARKAELVPDKHLSLEEEIDRATFEKSSCRSSRNRHRHRRSAQPARHEAARYRTASCSSRHEQNPADSQFVSDRLGGKNQNRSSASIR